MSRRSGLALALLMLVSSPSWSRADQSRMTGRVLDAETLAPIAGAEVELANMNAGQGFFRTHSDAKGTFAIQGIASNRYYTLTVSARGYADFVVNAWQFPEAQRSIDVAAPLDRAGTLEVRATRADGATSVANARVSIVSERAERWWQGARPAPAPVFTDAKGVARFVDIEAGNWAVTVDSPGLLPAESRQVAVRRGETTRVPASLVKAGSLSGTVQLSDGSPVGNVTVTARGPAEGVGTSGPDGGFSIEGLPPGRYRLDLTQDGFQPYRSRESVALDEGATRSLGAVVVAPKLPEFAIVMDREAFVPGTEVRVGLRSFRVPAMDLTIFSIPTASLLDPARDFRRYADAPDTLGLSLVKRFERTPAEGPLYTWREEQALLPNDLAPGAYLLRVRGAGLERRAIFFVTDLGILVKRAPTRALISAASLKTGAPVSGASVSCVPTGVPRMVGDKADRWQGALHAASATPAVTTDPRGLVEIARIGSSGDRYVAISPEHGVSVAESPFTPDPRMAGDRVYLYTERPIYRPGQTVYWKLFARSEGRQGYVAPSDDRASVALIGPDGSSRAVASTTISRFGSSDSSFVLPSDAPLGDWRVAATVGRATSAASFAVQEYRKPEFKVDVAPDRPVYVNGDEIRFVVAASYFFGSPVFGATVRYNLFESRMGETVVDGEDDDGEGDRPQPGYGRVLTTGEARTDVDGRVAVTFTPPRVTYDRRVSLEVEVIDASNRGVSARGSAIVGRGLFTIQVEPSTAVVVAGQPISVDVRTRDHLGTPVAVALTVDLDQDSWSPLEHRYVRSTRPLASSSLTTDANGKGTLSLLPNPVRSGFIKILARADDAKGNHVTGESGVWVYDASVHQYAYRYPNLEALLDKDHYAAGDTARILVNTDARNAQVLATVEGKDLESVQIVNLDGNTGMVSIPVHAEYAPNVYVSVSVRRGAEVRSRTLDLPVAGPKHDLKITLEPDRAEYRPRGEARIRVETRDAGGRPRPAEVSIGIVDEAIYSLRADDTPDPHDVFYGKRPNWVVTSVSFPLLYYGGVDKGREREVRKDFRDVALWAPVVRTDETGTGEVTLHWPDNLTTWRITSRGMTEETLVGEATAKALVTKPVVARMALPRIFIAGDESSLLSIVNNRSARAVLGLKQSIQAGGLASVAGATSRADDLPPNGESRATWPVRIARDLTGDSAAAQFTFRATGADDADALELSAPVLPRAVALGSRGAGVLERASADVNVALPPDLVKPGSWVSIECSPSLAAMAVTATNYLVGYPYSCTEQTANAILAGVALAEVGAKLGGAAPGWGDAAKKVAPFLDHLAALQSPDGGWGWWSGLERDPYLTALAVEAMARADAAGLGTPTTRPALEQGARVIPQLLAEERSLDGQCYVLARVAPVYRNEQVLQQVPGFREEMDMVAGSVYASRDRLGTAALALAARAHADMGRMNEARTLISMLKKQAVSSGGETHWPGDPDPYAWFGEDVENTGYALAAILSAAPSDPISAPTVRWLAGRRHGGYWRSTRSTAPVVSALGQYLLGHLDELAPNYRLVVRWNGEVVMDRVASANDAYGSEGFYVRVPGSRMRGGDNKLTIARNGDGRVYYAWEARANVPSPGPTTASEKRLTVAREYLRAERTADRRGRPRYLATPIEPGDKIRIGEPVLVRLTLKADRDLRWILIEDPRPSGFEVSELQPQGTEWPWDMHAEQRDDRNLFFVDRLDQGETVIEYLDRPEMEGAFTALPVSATSMYVPDLAARSDEARLMVGGR